MMPIQNDQDEGSVGRNVATERKLRGLSQRELADQAHVSHSLLSKVEAAMMPASPAFVGAAARALALSTAELYGQPYRSAAREDRVHATLAPLRAELAIYNLPPRDDTPPVPFDELAPRVAEVSRLRHQVNLLALGERLPTLLADLRRAAHGDTGPGAQRVYQLMAETYAAAGQLAYKLGYTDLASITVDRYEWAAARSEDPLAICVGDYQRAGELLMADEHTGASELLEHSRARIDDQLRADNPPALSTWGNLHLKSALVAARAGDGATADNHLAEARDTAGRIGHDRDDYRLAFGPSNVDIWSVGLSVELVDGTTAVSRAEHVHLPRHVPRERASHHHIDLARGWLYHGDTRNALAELFQAREISPSHTRYHPQVRETVHTLAELERRSTDTLTGFANWLGLNHRARTP